MLRYINVVVQQIKFVLLFDKNVINSPISQEKKHYKNIHNIIDLYNKISYHVGFWQRTSNAFSLIGFIVCPDSISFLPSKSTLETNQNIRN